jgi:DNA-binding CsgD family transcriptional regulator
VSDSRVATRRSPQPDPDDTVSVWSAATTQLADERRTSPFSPAVNTHGPVLSAKAKAQLREEIEILRFCTCKETALDSFDRVAALIEMPLMASSRDVAQPYYGAETDAFIRLQNWPPEVLELWREHSAGLQSPLYERCRFTHLPFVTSLDAPLRRAGRLRCSREERMAEHASRRLGLRSLLTVPVHLPLGQVAMLTWAGSRSPASAEALLDEIGVELLAAAHYTIRILRGPMLEHDHAADPFRLTPREWDCLRLTAQGFREADVARLVKIAPTTVRYHIDNVVKKLNASNRTHAVAMAAQLGLLGPIGA